MMTSSLLKEYASLAFHPFSNYRFE